MFINHVLKFVKLRVKYVCTGSENTNLGTERKITIINAKKKKKTCDDHFEMQVDLCGSRGAGQILPIPQINQETRLCKKYSAVHSLGKMLNLTFLLQPLFGELFQGEHSSSNHDTGKA